MWFDGLRLQPSSVAASISKAGGIFAKWQTAAVTQTTDRVCPIISNGMLRLYQAARIFGSHAQGFKSNAQDQAGMGFLARLTHVGT